MKRVILYVLYISLLAGCGAPAAGSGEEPETVQLIAMDTVMTFAAYGDRAAEAVVQAAEEMERMERILSRTLPNSEVSRLNAVGSAHTGPEVQRLAEASAHYREATGGAFDITVAPVVSAWGFTTDSFQVPSDAELAKLLPLVDGSAVRVDESGTVTLGPGQSIDLGGIAKGYASDLTAALYASAGIERGKAELGGNVLAWGTRPDGKPWRVGIKDPARPEDGNAFAGIVELEDSVAITSGGYQRFFEENGTRYHHIIDPSTGYPAESGLTSVTVVAKADGNGTRLNGAMCDAYSTALFIMGEDRALDFWRTHQARTDYEDAFDLVLVTEDGRVVVTAGLSDRFEPSEDSGYVYETAS